MHSCSKNNPSGTFIFSKATGIPQVVYAPTGNVKFTDAPSLCRANYYLNCNGSLKQAIAMGFPEIIFNGLWRR
jgi:hypothetical protein